MRKKRIVITAGEPASISTEITIKSLLSQKISYNNLDIIFVTDPTLLKMIEKQMKIKLKINILKDLYKLTDYKTGSINIVPIKLNTPVTLGNLSPTNCSFVKNSILTGINLIKDEVVDAIVTNPINKYIMKKSGFDFPGHTEFLGYLSKLKTEPIMLLEAKKLRVVPLTTHVPLKEVSKKITKNFIIKKIQMIESEFKSKLKICKPKIFISGLNPHAGDKGQVGKEEIEQIIPAIKTLKKSGYNVCGPISSDTLFEKNFRTKYDVAVCMYHDQALIPIKSLSFNNVVNITLGIDYIRTSPDHGTALEIAGKNKANPQSLINAINKAQKLIS